MPECFNREASSPVIPEIFNRESRFLNTVDPSRKHSGVTNLREFHFYSHLHFHPPFHSHPSRE